MPLRKTASITLGVTLAFSLAACGDSENSEETNNENSDGSLETIQSWDPCEIFDIEPLEAQVDFEEYMQEGPASSEFGQGTDGQAVSCESNVLLSEFETPTGRAMDTRGILQVGVIPWATNDDATQDFERRAKDRLNQVETAQYELVSDQEIDGPWELGRFTHREDEFADYIHIAVLNENYSVFVDAQVDKDQGIIYHENAGLDDDVEDWRQHSWEIEDVEEFIVNTYVNDAYDAVINGLGD